MKMYHKIVHGVCALGMAAAMFSFNPKDVHAIRQNKLDDPAPNTASLEIEQAIAKGKELVGVTDYWWGGGHGGADTKQYNDNPPKLDCSSFVHWAYNKGAGMMLGEVGTTTSYKQYFSKYKLTGLKKEDFKRGDLVYLNGGTHIVIWLGGDAFIGCQGYGSPDKKGGVQISDTKGYKIDGVVIRIDKNSEGVKPGKAEPLKNGSVTGTTGGTTTEKKEGEGTTAATGGSYKEPFNPFIQVEQKGNVKGADAGDRVLSQDVYMAVNDWFKKAQYGLFILAMLLSAVLIVYTSSVIVWYFALLPRNGAKGLNMFEKFSGMDAIHDRRTSLDLCGRWVVSVAILGFFVSKSYVVVMSGIYKGILTIMS